MGDALYRRAQILRGGDGRTLFDHPQPALCVLDGGRAGVGAQIGSFSGIILFALLCAGAFHIVILREEKFLKEALGAPYQAYLDKVPRFFPKLSLYQEGDTGSFKPRLLLTTLLDGLVFLVALPAFELIDGAQQSGMLPVWFTLP